MEAAQGKEDVSIWPENWPVFDLFAKLGTQWNVGMAGPTGLRYEALYPLLDRQGLSDVQWSEWFDDIRAMEREALAAMQQDS